jgi:hypothetical protein
VHATLTFIRSLSQLYIYTAAGETGEVTNVADCWLRALEQFAVPAAVRAAGGVDVNADESVDDSEKRSFLVHPSKARLVAGISSASSDEGFLRQ